MYLDYFPLTQSLSSSYNFFNTQILPNLYDNGTSLIQYAKDLYPVELHIHVLSHICSRHRQIALSNNGYKLNILDSVYNQCLGELIAQKLHKIIVNCQSYNKVSVHTPNTTTLLPGSNIFATEQLETALNATHKQLVLALTSHWNTYNPKPKCQSKVATINLKPVDIGSKGSTFIVSDFGNKNHLNKNLDSPYIGLHFEHDRTFTLEGLDIVHNIINNLGFVVIKNVLSEEHIQTIRDCLNLDRAQARDVAFSILEEDSNVNAAKYTRGRIVCSLRGTTYDTKLRRVQMFWTPLLHYVMPRSIASFPQNRQMSLEKSLYISWINLILSDPLSDYECWHRNNSKYGITVVIPLDYRTDEDGRIEFIPYTHSPNFNRNSKNILNAIKKGPVGVDVKPGDLIVYNSTILHRYTMNKSFDCKSDLVYQYDYVDSVPPGQGRLHFMYDKLLAKLIVFCNKFY
ncbi:conserved Plasmodium protein, unknown function [Babesia microti strain RI]|uniref:Phytanoyl-CoA dioxygenase n=1 Tax=Babesia microti (strain RI) TaxID=1133968 RepID=A0A1R4ABF8_BABMR|nr:conserved Plasmodium protein, unknown function [Babesia microti strain RI]SJK86275.1 conserved Plasmodium protein, unknown function [Babesia microti strain RI]|eukprot:XP_021338452.1 conserved Plasmodium protein, unknown function [Babesia microti strain RI]